MPHSNPKAISRSSFACFRVFKALVPFGALASSMAQIPQMMVKGTQKVIQTLQLIISHQMIPYSNPKAIWKSSLACFRVFGALALFGEQYPNRVKMSQIMVRETKKSFACFRVFGTLVLFGARGPSMTQIPQMMVREIQKVIQTLQLIISHQMIPYSNPKAIWKSSLACFRVFGALALFGEQYPNRVKMSQIMVRETKKSFACFRVFGTLVLFGARGPSMTQIP